MPCDRIGCGPAHGGDCPPRREQQIAAVREGIASCRDLMGLTPSTRLTARRVHDDAARAMAASIATFMAVDSIRNRQAMHDALQAYTEARTVLDG